MEERTTLVFPEFSTIKEGTDFMSTYATPVAFSTATNYYTYKGKVMDVQEYYHEKAPKELLTGEYLEGNEETPDGILYIQDNILKYNKTIEE